MKLPLDKSHFITDRIKGYTANPGANVIDTYFGLNIDINKFEKNPNAKESEKKIYNALEEAAKVKIENTEGLSSARVNDVL